MSAPDYKHIYDNHAEQYEQLVAREDYQQNIFRALNRIARLDGSDVVELGAGTGRLTSMLAPVARSIQAFDASAHMLDIAIGKLQQSGLRNWRVEVADHRKLPVADAAADIVIAGWSICYTAVWYPETWRAELDKALAEMRRVARPGGTIIILETLGTGYETPHPPAELADYYAALETAGFTSTWIRTDYRFASPAEAEMLTRFFFGAALAEKMAAEQLVILPECTGIWYQPPL
jgi:ubiquinone/menaquinone biosynthesis C-methylase UbiE